MQDITQTNMDCSAECEAAMAAAQQRVTAAVPMPDMPVAGMPMPGMGD